MTVKKKIRGIKDPDDSHPWYVTEITNGLLEITEDMDGALDVDLRGATPNVPDHVDLPEQAQAAMDSDAVYAVTTDGEFIAYEPSADLAAHDISLRAHLAWYDSDADEFTVLEFVE